MHVLACLYRALTQNVASFCKVWYEVIIPQLCHIWTLVQLKELASMQEHCVAALLRLHKKQIMRLRSPEDFIQVRGSLRSTTSTAFKQHSTLQNRCDTSVFCMSYLDVSEDVYRAQVIMQQLAGLTCSESGSSRGVHQQRGEYQSRAMLQFVNKDIVPIDGPATVNAAYKLWKQSGKQLPPPAASTKWTKLSKAEVLSTKNPDSLTVQAEAVGKDVST